MLSLRKHSLVIKIGLAGVLLTLIAAGTSYRWEERIKRIQFERLAQERFHHIERELQKNLEVIELLSAFFHTHPHLSRHEFHDLAGPLLSRHPSIQALEWIPRVGRAERPAFAAKARMDFPGFAITELAEDGTLQPARQREEYYPVYYVEPFTGNEAALGFDLASEPKRHAGLLKARQSGELSASAPIRLLQEKERQQGFLAFVPVYAGAHAGASRSVEYRQGFRGFMLGVFRVGKLVEKALDPLTPHGIDIWCYDVTEKKELLYHQASGVISRAEEARHSPAPWLNGFTFSRQLSVGGRHWSLLATPLAGPFLSSTYYRSWAVLFFGLTITLLLIGYFVSINRTQAMLHVSNRALAVSSNGVMIADAAKRRLPLIYVNPAFEKISGYSAEEVLGKSPIFLGGKERNQPGAEIIRNALRHQTSGTSTLRCFRKDGSFFWNELSVSPIQDEVGQLTHYVGVLNDITLRKQYERQLEYQATHDELTGLFNRHIMHDRLSQALVYARRHELVVGVLFCDLDQFKVINDSLDHSVGDQLLQSVARRLSDCAREEDSVARYGGDEFVIILPGLKRPEDATLIARRILSACSEPFLIDVHELRVTISIGISFFPRDGADVQTLVKNADAAMNRTKEEGRNSFQYYTRELNQRVTERLALESRLRRALEQEELTLHYQPQVDLATGKVIGMEALVRWIDPEFGLIPPGRFIPLAEEVGLIIPLGEWVLRQAAQQNKEWQESGLAEILVAINLSSQQFSKSDIVALAQQTVAATGLAPKYLELEITESTLMHDQDKSARTLHALQEEGFPLTIDDFGTGYSSFAYLQQFPFSKLKIDQAFVRNIATNPHDASIALTIISLAHSLGMRAIAEGVEDEAQLCYLKRQGCDEVQGFYYSKPLPAPEATRLLRENKRMTVPQVGDDDAQPTLLIVDDDPLMTNSLFRLLNDDGYRVLTTNDITEAFAFLATNTIQVVLSDQRMSQMEGTEFLSRVKDLYPKTVRILLTAYPDLDVATKAVNLGRIYKFMSKPWDPGKLRAEIREAFRHFS